MRSETDAPLTAAMGHFRILSELGRGGMGVVHEAWDDKLHRRVALKVLPDEVARDPERRERFLREARAAAAVSHPSIATVFQIEEWDGHLAIVMELAPGVSLRRCLRGGALAVAEAHRIASAIAAALAAAHRAGIAHRDLKPENVMVGETTVKLLDFGIAKALASRDLGDASATNLTHTGQVIGTAGYMAPEQATGGTVDQRADVFALGVVLFEMLTGELPFGGATPLARAVASARDAPRDLKALAPHVPAELVAVVSRCLEKEPAARFVDGSEVAAALGRVKLDVSTSSSPAVGEGVATTDPHAATHVAPNVGGSRAARSEEAGAGDAAGAATPAGVSSAVSRPSEDPAPAARPTSRSRKGLALAAAAAAIALATGLGVARWPFEVSSAPPVAAPSAAPSAPPAPGPREAVSSVPAADLAYRKGLQALWDADKGSATTFFEEAVAADPTCAPALLRLARFRQQSRPEKARENLAAARASRDRLAPRDQAMLEALESYVRDPPDLPAWERRVQGALERFPGDPELLLHLGTARQFQAKFTEAIEAYDAALTADPRFAYAAWLKAQALELDGRLDEARRGYDACVAIAPSATTCLWDGAELHSRLGRCAEAETGYRRLLQLEPNDTVYYERLASVLFKLGRPREGIEGLLRHRLTLVDEGERKRAELRDRIGFLLAEGDFAKARTLSAEHAQLVMARPDFGSRAADLGERVGLAQEQAWLEVEMGNPGAAGEIAMEVLRSKDALKRGSAKGDASFNLMHWARSAGLLSDAELERAREDILADARARRSTQKPSHYHWALTYAIPATTEAEARAALAALPRFEGTPDPRDQAAFVSGKVYLLAGDAPRAIAMLRGALDNCDALGQPRLVHTRLLLGEALEKNGDKEGACLEYARVVAAWGRAKPRSVTAERARSRASGLGCPAVP